jgi:hypothetical protein
MAKGRKTGGRAKGTRNKRTLAKQAVALERQEQAVASGVTPLEVMIADMRFHHAAAISDADLTKLGAGRNQIWRR